MLIVPLIRPVMLIMPVIMPSIMPIMLSMQNHREILKIIRKTWENKNQNHKQIINKNNKGIWKNHENNNNN